MLGLALPVALQLVSMNSAEVLASGDSIRGDISRDGRIVVFDSLAKTSLAHSGSGLALTHSRARVEKGEQQ